MKNKILVLSILTIGISLNLCACNKNSDNIEDYNVYKIACIEKNDSASILYREYNSNKVYEVNSENKILNDYTTTVDNDVGQKELLDLFDTEEYKDISSSIEMLGDYTYYMSIEQSTKYINFMKESGYDIIFKANTPEFIELVLTDSTGTRRVIITENTMTIAKVDGYSFNINNYINK